MLWELQYKLKTTLAELLDSAEMTDAKIHNAWTKMDKCDAINSTNFAETYLQKYFMQKVENWELSCNKMYVPRIQVFPGENLVWISANASLHLPQTSFSSADAYGIT